MAVVPVPAFDRVSFVHEGVRVVGTVTAQSPLPVGGWLWTVTLDGGAVVTVDPLRCAYAPADGIRVGLDLGDGVAYTASLVDVQRWNGWASPWFTVDEGKRVAADSAALRAEFGYDAELIEWDDARGVFTVSCDYGDGPELHDVSTLVLDGVTLHGIGAWSWTWDEASEPADDDDDDAEPAAVAPSLPAALASVTEACAFYGVPGFDGEAVSYLDALMRLAEDPAGGAFAAVRAAYGIVY